jgi:hypothetical protein
MTEMSFNRAIEFAFKRTQYIAACFGLAGWMIAAFKLKIVIFSRENFRHNILNSQ